MRVVVICLCTLPLEAAQLSVGCKVVPSPFERGRLQVLSQDVSGLSRKAYIFVPSTMPETFPMPLMMWLHGQGDDALSKAKYMNFTRYPLISIYPQGINDYSGQDCGTGWNLDHRNISGGGHDQSTCTAAAFNYSCCYRSCLALGVCKGDSQEAMCGWGTCVDDYLFFETLLDEVANKVCIDLDMIFLGGASFGGMRAHALYQQMPGRFRAVVPVYGLPLHGYNVVPASNTQSSILQLHGRSDTLIPPAGGEAFGWIYESLDDVLGEWATLLECDRQPVLISTEFDGGSTSLRCSEWKNCHPSRIAHRVLKCLYDGAHGSWPEQAEALIFWFFMQYDSTRDSDRFPWWVLAIIVGSSVILVLLILVGVFVLKRKRVQLSARGIGLNDSFVSSNAPES